MEIFLMFWGSQFDYYSSNVSRQYSNSGLKIWSGFSTLLTLRRWRKDFRTDLHTPDKWLFPRFLLEPRGRRLLPFCPDSIPRRCQRQNGAVDRKIVGRITRSLLRITQDGVYHFWTSGFIPATKRCRKMKIYPTVHNHSTDKLCLGHRQSMFRVRQCGLRI